MCSMCHPTARAGTEPAAPAQGTGGGQEGQVGEGSVDKHSLQAGKGPMDSGSQLSSRDSAPG